MDSFSELIQAVQSDLNVDSNNTLFSPTTIKLAINRAYYKAGGLFDWPELEDAKKTSTIASQEYYDYPDNWRPDSMFKLVIDGEDYGDPLDFRDFETEKEEDWPSGADVAWSSQWRRFFVYPIPTTNGNNNMTIHGIKSVDTLTLDADVTIFSYSMRECNDAIVMEAVAILKNKGENEKAGQFRSIEAKQILAMAWSRIKRSKAKYEKTQSFFNVPDFFGKGTSSSSKIGKF